MKKTRLLISAFLTVFAVSIYAAPDCLGVIYEYVDNKGTVHFTDDIENVPQGMRRKVKTIEETAVKEEPAPDAPTAAAEETAAQRPKPEIDRQGLLDRIKRQGKDLGIKGAGVRVAIGTIAAVIIFLALGRLINLIGFRRLGSLISLVLTIAVFFYLLRTHIKKAAETYKTLKSQVTDVTKKLEERGKEAEKMLQESVPGSLR